MPTGDPPLTLADLREIPLERLKGVGPALEARLGYTFRDRTLGETALTHTSWLNEATAPDRTDNERLEFLGDRVLGLVVAELLWRRFPNEAEGELTRRHTHLVRREALAV